MIKGLDAWERIKKGIDTNEWQCDYWDDIETIEKELKEYEKLQEDIKKCSCWKEHKTLEKLIFLLKNKYTKCTNLKELNRGNVMEHFYEGILSSISYLCAQLDIEGVVPCEY